MSCAGWPTSPTAPTGRIAPTPRTTCPGRCRCMPAASNPTWPPSSPTRASGWCWPAGSTTTRSATPVPCVPCWFTRVFGLAGRAALPDYFEIAEFPRTRPSRVPTLTRTAARVMLLDDADRVLLLSGTDPAVTAGGSYRWWITPGGGVETGRGPAGAALRELAEETGLHLVGGRSDRSDLAPGGAVRRSPASSTSRPSSISPPGFPRRRTRRHRIRPVRIRAPHRRRRRPAGGAAVRSARRDDAGRRRAGRSRAGHLRAHRTGAADADRTPLVDRRRSSPTPPS